MNKYTIFFIINQVSYPSTYPNSSSESNSQSYWFDTYKLHFSDFPINIKSQYISNPQVYINCYFNKECSYKSNL